MHRPIGTAVSHWFAGCVRAPQVQPGEPSSAFEDIDLNGPVPTNPKERRRRHNILAYALTVCSAVAVLSSAAAVQSMGQIVPHAEITGARYIFVPVILGAVLLRYRSKSLTYYIGQLSKCLPQVNCRDIIWLSFASMTDYFETVALFGSIYFISLGTVSCLHLASQTIVLGLVSACVRKKCTSPCLVAVLICFVGMLFMMQPEFLFTYDSEMYENQTVMRCSSVCGDDIDLEMNSSYYNATTALPFGDMAGNRPNSTNCRLPTTSTQEIENGSNLSPPSVVGTEIPYCDYNQTNSTNSTQYTEVPEGLLGNLLAVVSGVIAAVHDIAMNGPLSDKDARAVGFLTSLPCIALSLLQLVASQTFTVPDCWLCVLMLVLHAVLAAAFICLWTLLARLCSQPIWVVIVYVLTLIPTALFMQYTLPGMNPGLQNWGEVVGAALCLAGIVMAPVHQLWCQKRVD